MKDLILEKYNNNLKFIEDNLAPFKFSEARDGNAYEKYMEASREAVESYKDLLSYRVPKKVIFKDDAKEGDLPDCPTCGCILTYVESFCDFCGQRLDWRKE